MTNGLKAGDKVIVDGVAKVKEGQEVSAKPYQAQPANFLKVQHQMLRNRLNQVNLKQNRKQLQMHKG